MGFKKRDRPSDSINQSNDTTPFFIEPESASSVNEERTLTGEDPVIEFMEQGDDNIIAKEEDIEQILDQIPLHHGCSECACDMECMCVAEVETLHSADIDLYSSTPVYSDDEDDVSGDQDEKFVVGLSPDWPEDVFKDRMTNLDTLQTWREDIMGEENTLQSRLQEWTEDIHSRFEDDTTIILWLQEWPVEVIRLFSDHEGEWQGLVLNAQTITIALAPLLGRMIAQTMFLPIAMVL